MGTDHAENVHLSDWSWISRPSQSTALLQESPHDGQLSMPSSVHSHYTLQQHQWTLLSTVSSLHMSVSTWHMQQEEQVAMK